MIKVLDHGFVRLVDSMGSDLSVVRAARVSYDADWRGGADESKDEKLIAYLLKNKHTSPFEAVVFTFEVKIPLFLTAQWQRHRTWAYNQVSARYTELPEEYYIPDPVVIGQQSATNKQMRDLSVVDEGRLNELTSLMKDFDRHNGQAFQLYKEALARGVPRELARSVLPVGTYTRFFATVNLHNLLHFLRLRLHPHAQWEIREYANALVQLIRPVVPVTMKHFEESLDDH
jgi:thymidylate synthase (FAD)